MSADVNVTGVRGGGEEDSVLRSYVVTLVNGSGDPSLTRPEPWVMNSVNLVHGAGLVMISLLGVSFNLFIIFSIVPNRRLRTVRNVLLVHLGGVGLASSLFSTLYPALLRFHGQWVGGAPMCQTYAYVTCVFTSVSVWTIAALSWDKYQTIASPLHHSLTATVRKMLPSFSALWLCGLLLSLPPLLGGNEFTFHPSMGICGVNSASVSGRWYTCLLVCLSFIFPFCLMIYCYAHIFRIARTQSSRIAATMLRMVSVIQAPIAPATQNSLSMRGTKAMGTILQLIGSFVLTYLPYAVIILYEVIFAVHANTVFVSIATTLFLAAPFTHAAIYGIRNQILRTSFYRYARRKAQRCCAKDKRRGSVKSQGRRVPNHLKLPMKCIVKSDGRQYVLRRTLSYQDKDGGVGREAIGLGHAEGLTRPHSYNVLQKTFNGRGGGAGNGGAGGTTLGQSSPRQNGNVVKHEKEVSFSDQNEISYILPDGLSHGARPEISFYSKDIMKEMSVMDSEMEALNGPGFEDREEKPVSVFHIGEEDEEDEEEFH